MAVVLKRMKGLRNLLVHEYGRINDEIVFETVRQRLGDFDSFKREVVGLFWQPARSSIGAAEAERPRSPRRFGDPRRSAGPGRISRAGRALRGPTCFLHMHPVQGPFVPALVYASVIL